MLEETRRHNQEVIDGLRSTLQPSDDRSRVEPDSVEAEALSVASNVQLFANVQEVTDPFYSLYQDLRSPDPEQRERASFLLDRDRTHHITHFIKTGALYQAQYAKPVKDMLAKLLPKRGGGNEQMNAAILQGGMPMRVSFIRQIAAYLRALAGGAVYVYEGGHTYADDEPSPTEQKRAALGAMLARFMKVRDNGHPIRREREERERDPRLRAFPFISVPVDTLLAGKTYDRKTLSMYHEDYAEQVKVAFGLQGGFGTSMARRGVVVDSEVEAIITEGPQRPSDIWRIVGYLSAHGGNSARRPSDGNVLQAEANQNEILRLAKENREARREALRQRTADVLLQIANVFGEYHTLKFEAERREPDLGGEFKAYETNIRSQFVEGDIVEVIRRLVADYAAIQVRDRKLDELLKLIGWPPRRRKLPAMSAILEIDARIAELPKLLEKTP